MDVIAHRALSPLSASSGASPSAEGTHFAKSRHLSKEVSLTVLINTHYTGLALCSHELLLETKISCTGTLHAFTIVGL